MSRSAAVLNEPIIDEPIERRMVYNGDAVTQPPEEKVRVNKPVRKTRRSPFGFVFITFTFSMLIVLYIGNKLAVNSLTKDVSDLHEQYQKVLNANEALRAEINQKSRLERIEKISTDQLKLTYPKEQPVWFDLDADKAKLLRLEQ
jgi:cell division protein FtsL